MERAVSHVATDKQQTTAHAGKCPFNHGQVRVTTTQSTTDKAADGQREDIQSDESLQSSEAVAALNGCPLGYAASVPVQDGPPAVCPMGQGSQPGAVHAGLDDAESSPAPAQCPMGFKASDGPRMTQLHCVICKSLLYNCVQLNCSCKYCKYCVANFSDCPLCGADITSRTAATELQGIVDTYIKAHAGTQNLFDIGKAQNDVQVGEATSQSRSAFLLQLAVRSAAGGNHPAAIDRLGLCKAELLKQVESEGHTVSLCSQLGAVCGSQGDCHRQLEQSEQAKGCYEESVQHLKACQSNDAEVKQPLSVSYNKLGDLEYGLGNVEAAVNWYKQGLCIREEAVQGNERAGPSEQLDVAVSTIKVADACQVRPFCGQQSMRQRWFVFNCMQATCRLLSTAVTAALAALGRVNNTSLSQSQLLLHKASCSICQQSVLAFSVNNAEHLDVACLRQVHWC
ncbi:TPA: hypothetical protein ACH3X3_003122 [Trebouxia sp. C0006]